MEMIEKRVRDGSVLRFIRKWTQVAVIEESRLLVSETGTGQGQTISPLLANIHMHYVRSSHSKLSPMELALGRGGHAGTMLR
jgi:retron-type reverse transcriptase